MQSTALDNIRETDLSIPVPVTTKRPALVDTKKHSNSAKMQLISQKSLKENENTNNSISPCHFEELPENHPSPSKSRAECSTPDSINVSGADADPETDASGKTDEENIESAPFESSGEYDSLNLPDPSAASSIGRHASMTSVASSRTSRESGYFSSSSAESPQLQLQSNGVEISIVEEDPHHIEENGVAFKQIESVPEEKDEDVKRATKNHEASSANQSNDEALNDTKADSINQSTTHKERNSNSNHCETPAKQQVPKRNIRVSVKDINKKLSEIDHLAPTASMAMDASFELTYVDRVILELIETERMFVRALEDILAGYDLAIKNTPGLPIKAEDAKKLFGNIKDIYAFNRKFLSYLENCESDPVKVGQQFVSQDASFSVYTEYCTNYPISVSILTRCMKNPVLAQFFKTQQESLRHTLPLGAYLLKPVQRILKYRLILQEMVKNCEQNLENFSIITQALATMTFIARHINEMKRKNEDAVHIQELQSLLTNWPGDDLTTHGKIVMEGDLKLQRARSERLVFLFDKMILISKRREDGFIMYKTHIMCSDLILLESVKDNPLSFLIAPFDHPVHTIQHNSRAGSKQYIFTVRYPEEKKLWTQNIKRQILINHHTAIPLQAQQSIMNMDKMKMDNLASKNSKKRPPPKLFGTTLSPSTLDSNGKLRRRTDSINRKTLPKRTQKKKQESNIQEKKNSELTSEQNTATPTRSRFSIPWINKNSSPKHEPSPVSNSTSHTTKNEKTVSSQPNKTEKTDQEKKKTEEIAKEKEEQEKKFVKKRGKNGTRRNGRHKESVIYKRYKRRKSQSVVTDIERESKDPQSPKPQARDEKKKLNSEMSIDDFESFDDFLCCTVNNSRESVSWDVQIVEAVFERFNQDKEPQENKENHQSENKENTPSIVVPKIEKLKDPSDLSDDEDSHRTMGYDSNDTLISESVDELTPTEDLALLDDLPYSEPPQPSPRSKHEESSEVFEVEKQEEEEMILTVDVEETPAAEKDGLWTKEFNDESEPPTLSNETVADDTIGISEESDDDDVAKDDISEISYPESPSATIKRSLSTQSSYTDRRKYFEKLKEIRDRRHSNVSLNSYDANQIIQAGTVRDRIAHHRDYVASQVQGSTSYRQTQLSIDELSKPASPHVSANALALPKTHHYRRQRNSVTSESSQCEDQSQYNSMQMEPVQDNQFSTMTTGSLPLHFSSSSNSSSTSSINDAEEHNAECTSPTTPKYKVLLQPRLFLWRSGFNSSNARKHGNFAIRSQSEPKLIPDHFSISSNNFNQNERPPKNSLKDIGKIRSMEENKDELPEEDNFWEDFETKAKKFESLCRSSSSEKIHEKRPLNRSSFRTRKDLAAASSIKEDQSVTSFTDVQKKWKKELAADAKTKIQTTRLRFNSKRNSTSEADTPTSPSPVTVKRSSSYRSTTTEKTTTSIATTPIRLNTQVSESTATHTTTVRRSSSRRSKHASSESPSRSLSPVASSLSRNNSLTYKDRSSPIAGGVFEDAVTTIRRSNSYRRNKEPASVSSPSSNGLPVRRHSSRARRKATSASTEPLATTSNPPAAAVTTTGNPVKNEEEQTQPQKIDEITPPKEVEDVPKIQDAASAEKDRMEEVTEQCNGKGVLKLAQRFDQIAIISGNSNLFTGRNRLTRGRKHHSDLALPSSSETVNKQNNVAIAKKPLKRHQSCFITKTWQSRELLTTRRFSEAQFSESANVPSANPLTKQHSQKNPISPPPIKPISPKPRRMLVSRTKSQELLSPVSPPLTKLADRGLPPSGSIQRVHEALVPKSPPPMKVVELPQTHKNEDGTTVRSPPPTRIRPRARKSNLSESSNSDATPVAPSEKPPPNPEGNIVSEASTTEKPKSQPSKSENVALPTPAVVEPNSKSPAQATPPQTSSRVRTRIRHRRHVDSDTTTSLPASNLKPKPTETDPTPKPTESAPLSTTNLSTRTRVRGTRTRRRTNPPAPLEAAPGILPSSSKSNDRVSEYPIENTKQPTPISFPVIKTSDKLAPENNSENTREPDVLNSKSDSIPLNQDHEHNPTENHDGLVSSSPTSPEAEIKTTPTEDESRNSSDLVSSLCRSTESTHTDTTSEENLKKSSSSEFQTIQNPENVKETNSKTNKSPPTDFIALFCKI